MTLANNANARLPCSERVPCGNPSQNHPMSQRSFGFIIGQWPGKIIEYAKNGLPIIQEFAAQFSGLFMSGRFHHLTQPTNFLNGILMVCCSNHPPAKPGALKCEPLKAD